MWLRRAIFYTVVGLLSPSLASAHRQSVVRRVVIEPWTGNELHVLASIVIPAGKHRATLSALADRDRDGQLLGRERQEVETLLATRALDGVLLLAGSSTVTLERLQMKLRVPDDPKQPLELLIHGTALLPDGAEDLRLRTGRVGDPLELTVLAGKRPVVSASRRTLKDGSFRASLGPLDDVRWRMSRGDEY